MEELNQVQENLETTKPKKKIKTSEEIKQELINKKKEIEKKQVRRGNLDLVGEDEAKAIRVKISEDREIIFLNSTREVAAQKKTYLLDGVLFYGKTGFIDINKGEKELHIFKY